MNFTQDEKLALLKAVSDKIKPELEEAKSKARQELLENFEKTHSDRKAIMVGSEKVGEVGITFSSSKPVIRYGKEAEAMKFLREVGLTEEQPIKGWEENFTITGDAIIHNATGEVCEFLSTEESRPKTAVVRGCKPDKVLQAFKGRLQGVDATQLLEG